jgi:NADH-quinone oxidoreductase subunit N
MSMPLWAIVPELILAVGFLLLIVLAPFLEGKKAAWLYVAAFLLLAVSAYFTVRMLPWPSQTVFKGTYSLDPLAHFLKFYAIAATALMLLACFDYFRTSHYRSDLPAILIITALAGSMLAGSVEISLVVLFFYLLTIGSLILVGITKMERLSNEAALKFFLYGTAATAILIYGLSLFYGATGSTYVSVPTAPFASPFAPFLLAVILVGFGFKLSIAPFHMWAPDVYEGAPTPVSGLLSTLPKAAAVAIVLRFTEGAFRDTRGTTIMLEVLAALSMTVGNLWALQQTNLKRLLAYSSIAQIGYIFAAVSIAPAHVEAQRAALFYLAAYLFMNLGVFFCVARMELLSGTTEMSAFGGLWRRSPALAAITTLFLLSLAGVPPLSGYIAKVLVLQSLAKTVTWLAVVLAVNVVVGAYYYLRIIASMYLEPEQVVPEQVVPFKAQRSPWLMTAIYLCIAATLALGAVPEPLIKFLSR